MWRDLNARHSLSLHFGGKRGRRMKGQHWSTMQTQKIVEVLTAVQPAEIMETLRADGAEAIKDLLGCPIAEAATILEDYEDRQIIKAQLTPLGGALSPREDTPRAKFEWATRRP